MEALIILCTFPDLETARRIASSLVEEQLAACVNLSPGLLSIYRWEGNVESAEEVLGFIKTTPESYPLVEARIRALHPYDTPEILALPIEQGLEKYLAWLRSSVQPASPASTP